MVLRFAALLLARSGYPKQRSGRIFGEVVACDVSKMFQNARGQTRACMCVAMNTFPEGLNWVFPSRRRSCPLVYTFERLEIRPPTQPGPCYAHSRSEPFYELALDCAPGM
jgi:hypothetical protein